MYTTSAVISEDQNEAICKKFINPFLKKVDVKVNILTFDLSQQTTPFQYVIMKENFVPNMVICDIYPNTNF